MSSLKVKSVGCRDKFKREDRGRERGEVYMIYCNCLSESKSSPLIRVFNSRDTSFDAVLLDSSSDSAIAAAAAYHQLRGIQVVFLFLSVTSWAFSSFGPRIVSFNVYFIMFCRCIKIE